MKRKEEELCLRIYEGYRNRIYRYLKHKFPDIPQEDLRDIMQNVWADLVKDIHKLIPLDETDRLKWLLAVGKIEACEWYRKNQKMQFQSLEEVQEEEGKGVWRHLLPDPVQDLVLKDLRRWRLSVVSQSRNGKFYILSAGNPARRNTGFPTMRNDAENIVSERS